MMLSISHIGNQLSPLPELFQTIAFFRGDPTKTLSNAREMNPQFNANE